MNETIKNVLIFGIPTVIIIVIIVIVIKEIRGGKSKCPLGETMAFDGTCLQCDPQDPRCAVCVKPSDCKNGGTCYKDESTNGKGVCICTSGFSGLYCEKYCENLDDCNGQPCVDGQCICLNGMAPPDCKKPPDMKNCHPPNCNAITIIKMKNIGVVSGTNNTQVDIMYYGAAQDGINKTFKQGETLTLGGFFEDGANSGYKSLNGVSAIVQHIRTNTNENDQCHYYCCDGGGTDCDPTQRKGPFYPSDYPGVLRTELKCNPVNCGSEVQCFSLNCPKYNIVTVLIPTAKVAILTTNQVYSYRGDSNSWNSTAYFTFADNAPKCYNNTTNGSSDTALCESCLGPDVSLGTGGWGPGKEVMGTQYPEGKQQPPMGICGRKYPENPIQVMPPLPTFTDSQCQNYFGKYSCLQKGQCTFQGGGEETGDFCNITDFWSYPGSNCQTGTWNTCKQCGGTNILGGGRGGLQAFTNQSSGCGAIQDSTLSAIDCTTNTPTVPAPDPRITGDDAMACNKPSNLNPTF